MLISTHPGFLTLAFTPSLPLKHTHIHTYRHTHTHTHTLHTHKPIFHPKIHGGKSLSSSTSHSFSSTLPGTVPAPVPAFPLKSPRFSGKFWPIHCHTNTHTHTHTMLLFLWPRPSPVAFFSTWNNLVQMKKPQASVTILSHLQKPGESYLVGILWRRYGDDNLLPDEVKRTKSHVELIYIVTQ